MSLPLIKTLPILPMSPNERERAHWAKLKKEKDDFTLMIPNCPEAHRQAKGGERRRVEVVFLKRPGSRPVDPDALHFRCKSINDALVRRGWLFDDSPEYLELSVAEEAQAKGKPSATIVAVSEIQEVEEAA